MILKVIAGNDLKASIEIICPEKLQKIAVQSRHDRKKYLNSIIPSVGGIYFLFYEDLKLLYIGKALNIRQRVIQHLQSRKIPEIANQERRNPNHIKYVSYIEIEGKCARDIFETIYLNQYATAWNIEKINENIPFPEAPEDEELERDDVKHYLKKHQTILDEVIDNIGV